MFMQGMYEAMIETAKVASNAQLWNGGAPLAESAAVGALSAPDRLRHAAGLRDDDLGAKATRDHRSAGRHRHGRDAHRGELFRRMLLQNANLDGRGGVGITFTTKLQPGNGLWSSDVQRRVRGSRFHRTGANRRRLPR